MNKLLTTTVPTINGLGHSDAKLFEELYRQIAKKQRRNTLRTRYYEHKEGLKDLGIAIPPHLRDVAAVVGWSAKAVDAMSRRIRLEEFVRLDGGSTEDIGLDALAEANNLRSLIPQATTSALIHATSFGFVTMGDVEAGEPEALITVRSASWATGRWNSRMHCLDAALSIAEIDKNGKPTVMVMYTPGRAITMRYLSGSRWDLWESRHNLGMPVEQFPYAPTLDRPFGRSRINRPMMALTDSAVRTLLRTEIGAEFFNAPRAVALGADDDAFTDKDGNPLPGWAVLLGQFLTLSRDADGELPQIHEFRQQSMEPNLAQMRMYAQQFASEANLPLRSFGIVGDNPESADAIREANEEMTLEIDQWEDDTLGPALKRLHVKALRVYDDSDAARAAYQSLKPVWRNQESATKAAQADAFAKVASYRDTLGKTKVGLRMAGMDADDIELLLAEERQLEGLQTLREMFAKRTQQAAGGGGQGQSTAIEPALQGA